MTRASSPIARLGRAYRHVERLTEVVTIMVKFGFGDVLARLGLGDLLAHARRLAGLGGLESSLPRPRRVRLALEELGLVFIKWGQYLSMREDIIPRDYIDEFVRLRDAVPPVPLEKVKNILAEALESGQLRALSPEPVAAASIGQVHSTVLASGEKAVVKVKRPGLRRQVTTDLEILAELAALVEKHIPTMIMSRPTELVAEFSRGLTAELDFTLEAANLERFYAFYARRSTVKVPRLYRHLSNSRVLVMERIEGLSFNEEEKIKAAGYDLPALARLGAEMVFEQIMQFGLFHGDPHPGNLFVLPGPRIALLDFGLVGRLDRRTRDVLLDLTIGAVRGRAQSVTASILKLTVFETEPDQERLARDVEIFLETHLGRTLKEINLARVMGDAVDIARRHGLSLPPDLLLLVKALSQVEAVGLRLDPEFDLVAVARPLVRKLHRRRLSPAYWLARLSGCAGDVMAFLENLPHDLRPLFRNLRGGRIKAEFSVEGLAELRQTIEQASYRLAFAVVLGALVIGSSVVIHANIPPRWHDLPVLGLAGFLGAGIVGFWLLYDFLKRKKF